MATVRNTNAMMADTGGLSGAAGAAGKSTRTTASTQKNTNPTTTTQTKATTTTPRTTTTTTPKNTNPNPPTTTTTPQGTQTTVTHADGTVSTAYLVNGRTVDANGNAYQFKNGDQVKTAGGTYTVNNGVGTKNEPTNVTKTKNTTVDDVAKGMALTTITGSGALNSGKAGNAHSTVSTTPKNTNPNTTTPKAAATHTVGTTPAKNTNPNPPASTNPASTNITGVKNTTEGDVAATPTTQGNTVVGTAAQNLYDAVTKAYNDLQAEKNEILGAYDDLRGTQPAGGTKPGSGNVGAAGNANTAGLAQADTQGNASADPMAGAVPTYVLRNGQQVPAYILNGKTVDASGNPFSFQNGDVVHTQGGDYYWAGDATTGKAYKMGTAGAVDPSAPPSLIDMTPEEAVASGGVAVPIMGPNGEQVGTGYVLNGVTYIRNADGYLSRLTNPTDIPYIVRTQGGDYVMTKDGSYSLADYESKYGPVSNWTYQGGSYVNNGGAMPGSAEQQGTARAMTDYSKMTEGDLINYVMNAIEVGDEKALRDFMTWAEAESIARERMNPLYNQYIDQSMRNIDLKALQGGFYGQLPTEALRQQALAETEGNRTQAIIDYATQLLSADREGVLDEAKLNLDERQQRISTLLNLLESNRNMTQAEKDRELKKYIADQDAINAQGKLQSAADQFAQEMAYNREVQAQKNKQFYDDLELQKYIANLRY